MEFGKALVHLLRVAIEFLVDARWLQGLKSADPTVLMKLTFFFRFVQPALKDQYFHILFKVMVTARKMSRKFGVLLLWSSLYIVSMSGEPQIR